MNYAQLQKFHVNRRQWEQARAKRGFEYGPIALAALKKKTIGRVCSSKDFSQADLDKMIGAFLAETQPGNLDAQMEQNEMAANRRATLETRCFAAGKTFLAGNDANHTEWKVINYAMGICRKMGYEPAWPMADEEQLGDVARAIERQAKRLGAKSVPTAAASDGTPF